jgi:SM-20-related protein
MASTVPVLEAALRALDSEPDRGAPSGLPVAVLDEFLARSELEALVEWTLARRDRFRASQVLAPDGSSGRLDTKSRRSQLLFHVAPWDRLFAGRIRAVLGHVLPRVAMAPFPVTRFEIQVTASNDGEYFRPHRDGTHEILAGRRLTYVYFFGREPLPFEGGALRIFGGDEPRPETELTVAPRQNRIVFFPSSMLHEVAEVRCPSRAFEDSRFTVNGWLHG